MGAEVGIAHDVGGVDAMVVFGITGDLARKMTFPALYRLEERRLLSVAIVGVALDPWSDDDLRAHMRKAVGAAIPNAKRAVLDRLAARLRYVPGDFTAQATYAALRAALGPVGRILVYLEVPPALFGPIVEAVAGAALAGRATFLIEKPFGHDLQSAKALNERLHRVVHEEDILRVDHFLGKQPLRDLVYLRFGNAALEPLWRREHVAGIQITMAEDFGVEDRGSFYDPVGALRDVVQNHLLQLLALVLMESPSRAGDAGLWDARVDALRTIDTVDLRRVVRGQYAGYQAVPGVKPGSTTETYVALELASRCWRWDGVPIVLRAGKALARTVTEVRLVLRHPPRLRALDLPGGRGPNEIVIRIDPDPGIRLTLGSLDASGSRRAKVHLDMLFANELGRAPEPYEVLFHAALTGDHSVFAREDVVEETWRILDPLVANPPRLVVYPKGSWGPVEGDAVARRVLRTWAEPWLDGPRGSS